MSELGLRLDLTHLMRRLRHTDVNLTYNTYIANTPLLNRAQHEAKMGELRARIAAGVAPSPARRQTAAAPGGTEEALMSEDEAMGLLQSRGVVRESLRRHCMDRGKCETRDGAFLYSRGFVLDIAANYFTKQECMAILRLGNSGFLYWMSSRGIRRVQIGKTTLVPKDDVLAKCGEPGDKSGKPGE